MKVHRVHTYEQNIIQRLRTQPRHGQKKSQKSTGPSETEKYFNEATNRLAKNLPDLEVLTKAYETQLKAVNQETINLGMGLNNVLAVQENFGESIKSLVKNVTILEQNTAELTKGYGISLKTTDVFSKKIRILSQTSGIGEKKFYDYAVSLKDVTAGMLLSTKANETFSEKLLLGQQYMQNNLGLTEEAAQGYEYYATSIAKSGAEALVIQNKLAEAIATATGLDQLQVQKQLTEDIGGLTADLQVQYSRIPGSLELAVLKSKALGMSMQDLHRAGENLLNIESSIGQEMEYQLLSGKRLLIDGPNGKQSLTNAYRMATIQGDANKQAELMNHFIKEQGGMLSKNLYARKKAAELLGVDEGVLARSIQKQKVLTELGAQSLMNLKGDDYMKKVLELRKEAEARGDKDTIAKINKLITDSDLRSTDERMADDIATIATLTAKSAGIDLVKTREEALKAGKSFDYILKQFSDRDVMQTIGEIGVSTDTIKLLNNGYQKVATWAGLLGDALKGVTQKFEKFLITPEKIESTATGKSPTKKDAIIMNDGVIRFHQDDKFMRVNDSTMIAGTNVGGNRQLARAINGGGSIDYNKMAQAIATAMQNIKVQATIKADTLFAATKMNDKRRF